MTKFFRNLFKLILIGTPWYIITNYIKNFIPNYKTRNKSKIIESSVYLSFKSLDSRNKWFCNNLYFLSQSLKGLTVIKNILEIGSYEGRSAIFFLKFFQTSSITCVDTWHGSDEHNKYNFEEIERNFDHNVRLFNGNRLNKIKTTSDNFFKKNQESFDLIFLDGDHSHDQVIKDANNAWNKLNLNGYLIFDDYLWWFYNDLKTNPAFAINKFLIEKKNQIEICYIWQQVIIKKIKF